MRVLILGGTRFIGRAILNDLLRSGHDVMIAHRGQREPEEFLGLPRVHVDRAELLHHRGQIEEFGPDAAVDCFADSRADARAALAALPDGLRTVALSSMDVYRAAASLRAGIQ